ncbi:MAG: 2-hydroxyacyl-CoA dehydratase subunit D [Promethearchaeota archaeon]
MESGFASISGTIENDYLRAWKRDGGRVVGYYCTLTPDEVLHAAGLFPFRIRGTGNTDFNKADTLLFRFNCTYVRSTLNLFMNGAYDFLDGMVCGNSCDHVRRMYDIWGKKLHYDKPLFFLSYPHVISEEGRAWMRDELERFTKEVESAYGVEVTTDALAEAIRVYARNSELMSEVHDLLKDDRPRISGADFLRISVANNSVRKDVANAELEGLLGVLREREPIGEVRARLMVTGSYVDNPAFIDVLEHAGGVVVSQNLCTSERGYRFPERGRPPGDPLDALAIKHYEECACPRMMNAYKHRLEFLEEQVREMRVDGVVLQRIEFCDLHGTENMLLQNSLKELGLPTLNIDREYFLGDTGRLRTRVEAFLEKIGR